MLGWPYNVNSIFDGFDGYAFTQMGVIAGSVEEYRFLLRTFPVHERLFLYYVAGEAEMYGEINTLFALYGTFYTRPLYFFENLRRVCENPLKQNATVYLDWLNHKKP